MSSPRAPRAVAKCASILKYPVRAALNPFASSIAYLFPYLVSGSIIVSLVLGLPTVGPLLLQALVAQDMFLAGTIVLLLGVLTVIGTLDLRSAADVDRAAHPPAGSRMSATSPPRPPPTPRTASPSPRQLQLTWWRFRRHKLAVVSLSSSSLFYLVAIFADFLAVADPHATDARAQLHPAAGDPLFDDGAFQPACQRAEGRARPADLQARLHAGPGAQAADRACSPTAIRTISSA